MTSSNDNPLLLPCETKRRTIETHMDHVNFIKSCDTQQIKTLLLGDSLLESINLTPVRYLYPSITRTCLNCSVGGDGVQHLLYRTFFSKDEFNNDTSIATLTNNFKNFDTIVILIGTNNTYKKNFGKKIYEGIINIVDLIKKVNNTSRIIVLAIPPRTMTTKNSVINNKEALIITENTIICNNLLAVTNDKYKYCDITNDFAIVNIGTNQFELVSEYFYDDVHFSDQGYKIILERLTSLINK